MRRPTKAHLWLAARYLLAIVPLAVVLGRMDARLFLQACRHAAVWTVPFVVVSYYCVSLLQAVRWWITQRPFAPGLRLRTTIAYHFLAGTYSVALPSVAQDLVRTAMVSRHVGQGPGWGAAWMNRIVGLVAWICLCLTGLALADRALLPAGAVQTLAASLVVLAALLLVSFSKSVTRPLRALLGRVLPARILTVMDAVRQGVYEYRARRTFLAGLTALSVIVELGLVLAPAVVVYGISGRLPVGLFLLVVPLIELLVMVLPITPNGVGLREGLMALVLTQVGLTGEQTGLYVSLNLLGLVLKGFGGLPFLLLRRWTAATSPDHGQAPPA